MFSRFSRRGLCFLLALVTLCMCLSPALTQPAEAVAAGVVAGTVAIGATAVVAAMLSGLGVKPGSNSASWDNLVSQVENHLAGLGYIVDGVINVASFKPTDDPEKLKAAIAQDIVGLTAQWLSDKNVVADNYRITEITSSSVSFDGYTYEVRGNGPFYLFNFQFLFSGKYKYMTGVCSPSDVTLYSVKYGSALSTHGSPGSYWCTNGNSSSVPLSKTPFGVPYIGRWDDNKITSLVASFISGVDSDNDHVDVSSVPANFTDIPAAYPSWVSSGVADAGVTYLPIGIYIPGTEAKPLPTEVPDPTDATDPSKDPNEDPDIPYVPPEVFTWMEEHKQSVKEGFERIGDRVQQLQDGILPKIETFKDTVTQGFIDCSNWIQGLGESLASALDALGTKLSTGIQSCFDTLREFATQTFPSKMADVGQWIQSLPEKIAEAIQKILPEPEVPPGFDDMMLPGLKDFFPFCIPFDMYDMMAALCADPEAPKFTFATSFLGHVYSVEIDLSAWDTVAATVRYMVVAIYIVALAVATRKFIKW